MKQLVFHAYGGDSVKSNGSLTHWLSSILSDLLARRHRRGNAIGILVGLTLGLLLLWLRPTTVYADGPIDLNPLPGWFSNDVNLTYSVAWGDVDGDGDLDLAVGNNSYYHEGCACYIGGANMVYMNEGGILQTMPAWTGGVTDTTRSVAWGDMDGDGDLDLAVGNSGQPNKVYLNEGGILQTIPIWTDGITDTTQSVAWGDVNGDGYLDLAVGNDGEANKVYLNQEGGLQIIPAWTDAVGDSTQSVAWGDVDGDGDLDLAVGNAPTWDGSQYVGGVNRVYENVGGGTFVEIVGALGSAADYTTSVDWGDMDSDGNLDLVVGNDGEPNKVYLNNGSLQSIPAWTDDINDNTQSVAWGDVDGDGDLDLAVGNGRVCFVPPCTQPPNKVYLNAGGVLTTTNAWISYDGDATRSVAWGDVDGDGDLDLAVGNNENHNKVYLNQGAMLKTGGGGQSTGPYYHSVALGDADGDGDLDLAVGAYGHGSNRVFINGEVFEYWELGDDGDTFSVAWGDVNGDGALDLAAGNNGGPNKVYLNVGGRLQTDDEGPWTSDDNDGTFSVAWGDVDGDGDLDLAVGNGCSFWAAAICAPNKIYLNEGGVLTTTANGLWTDGVDDNTRSVAWGDVDGDGDLDLAVGNYGEPNKVYLNQGGKLETLPAWNDMVDDYTQSVAWGDVDGDGDLDLAVGNSGICPQYYYCQGQSNKLYLNDRGVLTTTAAWTASNYDPTMSVAWGDVDGDGDLDLAVGNWDVMNKVYLNVGGKLQIESEAPWTSGDTQSTGEVAWGDYNGDGNLDLVAANYGEGYAIYPNQQPTLPFYPGRTDTITLSLISDPVQTFSQTVTVLAPANFYAVPGIRQAATIPFTYTLSNPCDTPVRSVRGFYSLDGGGHWYTAMATHDTITTNLTSNAATHIYTWDIFGSGLFGQSDNVVFRLVAYPVSSHSSVTGTYRYTNTIPGPYQLPYIAAQTFPFRVRGMQVQVFSETTHISNTVENALVYRWNKDTGSSVMANSGGVPFRTDQNGYLQGRGQLAISDTLMALVPVHTVHTYAGALTFDGIDDYAIISNSISLDLGTNQVTLEAWVKLDQLPNQIAGSFASIYDSLEDAYVLYEDKNANELRFKITDADGTAERPGIPTASLDTEQWHHIAGVYDGNEGSAKIYLDGVLIDTHSNPVLTGNVKIGQIATMGSQAGSGSFFPGMIDEVRIWNIARSATDIQADMVRTLNGNEPGLVAYWPCDDPDVTTTGICEDRTNNGNALTLHGPTWDGNYLGGYTVYHTNGVPTEDGVETFTVTQPGVQEIAVTAQHPLVLFDLNLSLEWDAHNDPVYLQQLEIDLKKASAYLYDFTNGQIALGKVTVHQNADAWAYAHIAVQASNHLRPFAHIGGLLTDVVTETVTVDDQTRTLTYGPGQIQMGATWNRYGDPGQSIGEDWPLILAHELSHYLLYQYDVYLGLNEKDLLVPVDTCTGSAMGDVYAIDNTEFISDTLHWTSACSQTLAYKTLGRTEWETLHTHYPWLITPTLANPGPSKMPFAFTTVEILSPTTAVDTLEDPTFYLDYEDGVVSSSGARAFLLRDADDAALSGPDDFEYIYNLGSPIGGQNRLLARGARPSDRMCVFDGGRAHFGCEIVTSTDEELFLASDPTWQPYIQLSPINSTTFTLTVQLDDAVALKARLYPEFGSAFDVTDLAYDAAAGAYTGTLTLPYPALVGHVQVWVNEPAPRRETIIAYSIGGNPGTSRIGRIGTSRVGGIGTSRVGGIGTSRIGGIGGMQAGEAPAVSSDGQMILYTSDVITFAEGQFFTIQAMSTLPDPPPGRTTVGQGYNLVATPDTPVTGSVSIQYMGSDALVAGVYNENDLDIYFWDGNTWIMLNTELSPYFNIASAECQGTGIYALMGSSKIPLYGPGWNLFAYPLPAAQPVAQALLSISGTYTTVYGYAADDPGDPWKVYDVAVARWLRPVVNDLTALEFGKGYWINVSQAITLYLSNVTALSLAPETIALASPPDTFYGRVTGNATFTPTAEMPVEARIQGTVCGRDVTRVWEGEVVYVVDVHANDGILSNCGNPGDTVVFYVAGRPMAPTTVWDNMQLNELTLAPAFPVYLPLVLRAK